MDPRFHEAAEWISQVTGTPINDFHADLKSGVVLCNLVNTLKPGTIPKINKQNMPFFQMENIKAYTEAAKLLGVPDHYNFVTVDLFEAKDLNQVAMNIVNLKRILGYGFVKAEEGSVPAQIDIGINNAASSENKNITPLSDKESVVNVAGGDVKRVGPALSAGHARVDEGKLNEICCACQRAITAGVVNAVGKSWHPNCFVCKKCGVANLSRAKYYEFEAKPYCERCILIVNPQHSVHAATRDMGFKFEEK